MDMVRNLANDTILILGFPHSDTINVGGKKMDLAWPSKMQTKTRQDWSHLRWMVKLRQVKRCVVFVIKKRSRWKGRHPCFTIPPCKKRCSSKMAGWSDLKERIHFFWQWWCWCFRPFSSTIGYISACIQKNIQPEPITCVFKHGNTDDHYSTWRLAACPSTLEDW